MPDDRLPQTTLGWLPYLWNGVLFPGMAEERTALRGRSLLWLVVLPALLLYPTRGFHLLEPDEGRYAQIPREMLERGEWVVPTLQGEAYLDKPPLLYWLIALSYRTFGVSPEAARLVPAICVHLTILLVYLLGRRSVGERAAFWGALLLTVAPGFTAIARLLLLDGLLTLCVTLSVLAGFEAVRTGTFKPGWWLLAATASGLGFLTKGPIAELLLFVPLWVFSLMNRRTARVRWYQYAFFFSVVVAVNLPWYIAIYLREPEFLKHFFWEHNVMRFAKPFDHLQPVWFYVPILIGGLLPGTILFASYAWKFLLGGADAAATRSAAGGFWLLAGAWCVAFFSISGSKLPTYILPAYPFLCLALGEFVARSRWNDRRSTRILIGSMAALLLAVHHVGLPWYARERSPRGQPQLVERFLGDRETTVVCFPRYCNSLAFDFERSDMKQVHTREVNTLYVACHHRPRTVILFTHHDSLAGFRSQMPASLEIVEAVSLRRKYSSAWLTKLLGTTPWGLCDIAVVAPRTTASPAAIPRLSEGAE